ncbi:MAG: efflux RND transporter periplasmic adaptor subunit [Chloroflexota bacterium]|nr:efflux RND transporter periplasmic adaptor subunit [Anaerolineae bacterium]
MSKVKVVGIIALIAVVAFVGLTYLRGQPTAQAKESEVLTVKVKRGSVEESISATGNVVASSQATLVFETSGQVDEILVDEGETVGGGQVLIRLDDTALQEQVSRAEASLSTAQARLDQAKRPATEAELAAYEAAVTSARASLSALLDDPTETETRSAQLSIEAARNQLYGMQAQRDSTANNSRSTSGAVDAAEAQVLSAEVSVQQALLAAEKLWESPTEQSITMAQSQVDQAEAQLAQMLERPKAEDVALTKAQYDESALALALAKDALDDAVLTAPFSGTVLQVSVSVGDWASPGMPAVVVADTDVLILDVNVDELDIAEIAEGQMARLTFEALPKEDVVGTVVHIAPSSKNVSGAVAYLVEISFEPGDLPVRLGMTTNVDIVTSRVEDVLVVPNQAIESDREAGRYYVTRLVSPENVERIEVEIGLRDEYTTQILSGVDEGDVLLMPQIQGGSDDATVMPAPGMGMMGSFRGASGGGGPK